MLVAQAVIAAQGITGNLVDVRWLEQHRHDPDVLFLDASLAPTYGAKHLPGALNVDAMTYGGKEAPVAETERLYQSWGVSPEKRIVMYDQDGTVVHVPYTELLNPDGTPKAAKDIWNILTKAGVPRYGELVCLSDDPGEAAVTYFILKLMGYADVKVLVM